MAKGNGTTRGQSGASGIRGGGEGFRAERWMSDEGWREVLDELEADSYPRGWDEIDPDSRELALMQSGFTGLANEGADDIIFESTKEQMQNLISDELLNYWEGTSARSFEDMSITVGYKDGRTATNEEIQPVRPITDRQSYSTQKNIINQSVTGKDVSFVMVQGSWGSQYWAARGDEHINQYTGYEKWTRGRGTKRRDYVQDDWI